MNLALEFGCTVSELEERMTEREFLLWQMFNATRMLPARRIEFAIANVASWIGKTMGGVNKNEPLKSFLVELRPVVKDGAVEGDVLVSGFASVGMFRLGQGRKLKKVK